MLKAIYKIRSLRINEVMRLEDELKEKEKYVKNMQEPFILSSYTVPSVKFGLDKEKLSTNDKITAHVNMKAVPGVTKEHANSLNSFFSQNKLGDNNFFYNAILPATGKYDLVAKYNNINFRDFYEEITNFIDTQSEERDLIWATETSICSTLISVPEECFGDEVFIDSNQEIATIKPYLLSFDKKDRIPRPKLPADLYRKEITRSLNKASSIGNIARHDIDNFAYADLIPFYKRGWIHSFFLNVLKDLIKKLKLISNKMLAEGIEKPRILVADFNNLFIDKTIEHIYTMLDVDKEDEYYKIMADKINGHIVFLTSNAITEKGEILLNNTIEILEEKCLNESDLYIETIATLQVARLQRHWGTRTSFHTYIFNPANFEGGIHLLLHCLCGYVHEIYEQINTVKRAVATGRRLIWSGFFNVDPNPSNINLLSRLQVISLPLREILDMSRIILDISHEAAHAILISTGIDDIINKNFPDCCYIGERNIIVETLCDIIAFTTGFRGNYKKHYLWVSDIFFSGKQEMSDNYRNILMFEGLFRLFGIYLFRRFNDEYIRSNDQKKEFEPWLRYTIEDEFNKFINEINTLIEQEENNPDLNSIKKLYEWFKTNELMFDSVITKLGGNLIDAFFLLHLNRKAFNKKGDDATNAPLIEALCPNLIGKDYTLTHNIRDILRRSDLTGWQNILKHLEKKRYDNLKNDLAHEFLYALTEFSHEEQKKEAPIISKCITSLLVNYDITMRQQNWLNATVEGFTIAEEWANPYDIIKKS